MEGVFPRGLAGLVYQRHHKEELEGYEHPDLFSRGVSSGKASYKSEYVREYGCFVFVRNKRYLVSWKNTA